MKRTSIMRSGIRRGITLAALATLCWACSEDEVVNTPAISGEGIYFGVSQSDGQGGAATRAAQAETSTSLLLRGETDGDTLRVGVEVKDGIDAARTAAPATRGTQVTTAAGLPGFDVAAYYYATAGGNGTDFFKSTVSNKVNTDNATYYWPQAGTIDFLAIAPAGTVGTTASAMPSATAYESGTASFTYLVPDVVANQKDIMVAVAKQQNHGTDGTAVPLEFKHLLTAVQFKVGAMQFIQINSLTLSGVKGGTLTFTYNKGTETWSCTGNTDNAASYGFSLENKEIPNTSGLASGDEITGNSTQSMLLLMPQTTTDATTLTVNYTAMLTGETDEKSVTLSGQTWEAGKTTSYLLNIGTTFDVEIPRPADQDAHYIMLKMPYEMGALSTYVTSVTATAQWVNDGSNTSSKSGISLKFEGDLTETQKQGFWTDQKWVLEYSVDKDGNTIPANPVAVNQGNIRGESSLNIVGTTALSSGTIVLFIEENNGTTDRNGELILTATLTDNTKVVIGKGSFKQLCPSWNGTTSGTSIGVERIEDTDADGNILTHPYGFAYNRTVVFKNPGADWWIFSDIGKLIYAWSASSVITDDEGDFITLGTETIWGMTITTSITLNYGALNDVEGVASDDDGLVNTSALYNFTGGTDLNQVETDLTENLGWSKEVPNPGTDTPTDYAAYVALSRNRMYEMYTKITATANKTTTETYKATLYKDTNNNDIIEWYLPSSVEAQTLVETSTEEGKALNNTYWSSTAGSDADAYAHSYTYTNNVFGSINESQPRMDEWRVRAVRKKP